MPSSPPFRAGGIEDDGGSTPYIPHSFIFLLSSSDRNESRGLKQVRHAYLEVKSLVVSALAAVVRDVILRQFHSEEVLHQLDTVLGVVVVVVRLDDIVVGD